MSVPDLETLLTRLQDAEINVWIGTAPPGHIAAAVIAGGTTSPRRLYAVKS
jgi:hypothetical protein